MLVGGACSAMSREETSSSPARRTVRPTHTPFSVIGGYKHRASWLTGFQAPTGPPWRGYVHALAEAAIAQASARGRRSVCVDVYELGESTQAVLASLGFGPEHEDSRVWRVVLG